LALLPFSDPQAADLLAAVPVEERPETWWVIRRDGTPIPGRHGGLVALMEAMGLTRPLGRFCARCGLSPVLDVLDRRFNIWRRWMSRFVPQGPPPRRYP
jgi:hypothetical protein